MAQCMQQRNWEASFPNYEVRMTMLANKVKYLYSKPGYFESWKLV